MPNNNSNLQSNLLLLTQELPFANSTEFEVTNNCLKNNDFLHCLENNNLSNKIIEQNSNFNNNFNCKYHNENSFHKLVREHNPASLKVFHLNIRSFNKQIVAQIVY